jgi:hypothetical protein
MGEHKHNPVAEYYKKHPRARHLPLSFNSLKRKPKATLARLPEGRLIAKNADPLSCDHSGENLSMNEEDEEDS